MAQAGIHSLVGLAVRRWAPERAWLMLGIVLGNLLPDADNLAVAVATIAGLPTTGLHRTFTHSFFLAIVVIAVSYLIAALSGQPRWINLGMGLGIGISMHILLDLVLWFNGVALLWPIPSWVNFWSGVTPPVWLDSLNLTAEFLFFALFFIALNNLARRRGTDQDYLGKLRFWTWVQIILFALFTLLVYTIKHGFMTPYGAFYLLSLALAIGVTVRMRKTIETVSKVD
jgi:membrane-bound metal-dependent hydrolase YbcI (DUF457 family)